MKHSCKLENRSYNCDSENSGVKYPGLVLCDKRKTSPRTLLSCNVFYGPLESLSLILDFWKL